MYLSPRGGSLQLVYSDTGVHVIYTGSHYHSSMMPMLAAWERGFPLAEPAVYHRQRAMQEHIARRVAAMHGVGGLLTT